MDDWILGVVVFMYNCERMKKRERKYGVIFVIIVFPFFPSLNLNFLRVAPANFLFVAGVSLPLLLLVIFGNYALLLPAS